MIKILVVDDHDFFRKTLNDYLSSVGKVSVVGEAANGRQAVELAKKLKPQLILMDIQMPELNGVEACKAIKEAMPTTKVILYTMYESKMSCKEGITSADRCVPKDRLFDEIPAIIKDFSQNTQRTFAKSAKGK